MWEGRKTLRELKVINFVWLERKTIWIKESEEEREGGKGKRKVVEKGKWGKGEKRG